MSGKKGMKHCSEAVKDEVRRQWKAGESLQSIRRTFHLEDYTAHDFRDTRAAEWQEAGMPLGTISHLLGHATTTVTEKCYVKFRDAGLLNARRIMEKNASDAADFVAEEKARKPL